MTPDQIRFDDGAAYERYMGAWSQSAGAARAAPSRVFLDGIVQKFILL